MISSCILTDDYLYETNKSMYFQHIIHFTDEVVYSRLRHLVSCLDLSASKRQAVEAQTPCGEIKSFLSIYESQSPSPAEVIVTLGAGRASATPVPASSLSAVFLSLSSSASSPAGFPSPLSASSLAASLFFGRFYKPPPTTVPPFVDAESFQHSNAPTIVHPKIF